MAVGKRKRRKTFNEFGFEDRFLLPIDGPDGPMMFFWVVGEGKEDGEPCWMAEMPKTGVRMYLSKSLEDEDRKISFEEASIIVGGDPEEDW